ncbi:hypothetical protein LQW54_001612 [Pestalotiopsis sp. IQ-011]
MATNSFDDLALKFVLHDEEPATRLAIETAARQIEEAAQQSPAASRGAILQWVGSINPWLKNDDGEDNIIARGKALRFLAGTIGCLKGSVLKPDQIKLLINFFCSLFSSDHRAGIDASSQALGSLALMPNFRPTMGNDIIMGITKLGSDDFKRQTPTTRLTIYRLVRYLLDNELVVKDLAHQHGDTWDFMTALINLCRNERDPQNLVVWFEILRQFLRNFEPADQVVDEVFKTFSAYFPITLRASATPSGITVEDLKGALRSCFSAHKRMAHFAIPFLLNKLDQGEAVAVSVKVDILLTLESCLSCYDDPQQSVVPYADQVWSALKYEVRNGEIQDTIQATLKTLGALTKRLQGTQLQEFLGAVWIDISDDISNETYIRAAGRLLTSISGASRESFSLSAKQNVPFIVKTLKQTKSPTHQSELLGILNALLQLRGQISHSSTADDTHDLQDDMFGDVLFNDVFTPFWSIWTQSHHSPDRSTIVANLIDGMAQMVNERCSEDKQKRLCSDATCNRVFSWLGAPSITYPLGQRTFLLGQTEAEFDKIVDSATRALASLSDLYLTGFQHLLEQFLDALGKFATNCSPTNLDLAAIKDALVRLRFIAFNGAQGLVVRNTISLVIALLQGMQKLAGVSAKYGVIFVEAIHLAIRRPLDFITERKKSSEVFGLGATESQDWLEQLKAQVQGLPEIDQGNLGDFTKVRETEEPDELGSKYQLLVRFSMSVVIQLYRGSVELRQLPDAKYPLSISVKPELEKGAELYNHRLGQLAAEVISFLSIQDQVQLGLSRQAFLLFTEPLESDTEETHFRKLAHALHPSDTWVLCRDDERTAPLVLGVIQSLHPKAIVDIIRRDVVQGLVSELILASPARFAPDNRAAMDSMLTVLFNKYFDTRPRCTIGDLLGFFDMIQQGENAGADQVLTYRTALHVMAGYVTNYNSNRGDNALLGDLAEFGPADEHQGRQIARCFGILVSPKDYLTKKGNAKLKPLRGQWLYHQIVQPNLLECIPAIPGPATNIAAANRSVFVFAILEHIDYSVWRPDAKSILLIVIRSLQVFGISEDINSVLSVLLKILSEDADLVKEHLVRLITSTLAVYEMARNVFDASTFAENGSKRLTKREAAMCRRSCIEFLSRLPHEFSAVPHKLLPERQAVLRGLSTACGDPVREVRELAIVARRHWANL